MKKIFVVLFCLLSIFMLAGCEKDYNGDYYITDYQMYTNSPKKTKYKYLVYSEEEGKEGSNIEKREYYCLANNESHTYQVVMKSWLSAVLEHHIHGADRKSVV